MLLTTNLTIYYHSAEHLVVSFNTVFPTMGNPSSIFCLSESNSQCIGQDCSQCIGQDSLLRIPTSSFGLMLTPSEGHVLTHDALQL